MGWLEQLLRRAAPGDVPADPMAGSVMSPNYVPQTSRRQLGLGALRGLLDATPVGIADAVQSGINNMQSPVGAALRAVTGKAASPGDVLLGKLGLLGSGSGYDAGRFALNAAFPAMGLLGNQAGGALPKGYARNQSGAIVWHGSPHKFDRFDASKIGTGEGAQAYGHGLYLAESPEVAKGYQKALAPDKRATSLNDRMKSLVVGDRPVTDYGIEMNSDFIEAARKSPQAALTHIDERLASWSRNAADPSYPFKDYANEKVSAFKALRQDAAKRGIQYTGDGSLYKVDLPDDQIAKMLDWDKPLSEQPAIAQPFIDKVLNDPRRKQAGFTGGRTNAFGEEMTGADFYNTLTPSWLFGGGRGGAEAARQAGIPGIRYLDGGSRGTGSGTSNFVVFPGNEGLLNILERNGQPIR
jgi:hypothetical protein